MAGVPAPSGTRGTLCHFTLWLLFFPSLYSEIKEHNLDNHITITLLMFVIIFLKRYVMFMMSTVTISY
jgi:hypothetical protein